MKDIREFFSKPLKSGTPQAAVVFGVIGLVIAVLLLLLGFWKTVLVVACIGVGVFIGGVPDKLTFFRHLLGRFFPTDQ